MIADAPTADQVRALREATGLPQAQLAALAGYSAQPRWAELEAGRRTMDSARWELLLLRLDRHPTLRLVERAR